MQKAHHMGSGRSHSHRVSPGARQSNPTWWVLYLWRVFCHASDYWFRLLLLI